jgi:hypothetical protein
MGALATLPTEQVAESAFGNPNPPVIMCSTGKTSGSPGGGIVTARMWFLVPGYRVKYKDLDDELGNSN